MTSAPGCKVAPGRLLSSGRKSRENRVLR